MFVVYQTTRRTVTLLLIGLLLITTGNVLANGNNALSATDSPAVSFSQAMTGLNIMNVDALKNHLQGHLTPGVTISDIDDTPLIKGDPDKLPFAHPIKPPPPLPAG
jgi:hypothetical protein